MSAAPPPIRLAINGAAGRMGRALVEQVRGDARFVLCHVVTAASGWADAPALDVVVDFSSAAGLAAALEHCLGRDIALVSGTTGLDAALERRLAEAAQRIAILRAANFSLGVAVLTRLLRAAAAALPDWDLDIAEAHHRDKRDAPSGTALALGRAAADARGSTLEALAIHDRGGARREGGIGFAVMRGGDIVGEHSALLATTGERLELVHRATDRGIFARGALHAAAWLRGRPPGAYTLDDAM
ncbi:MAG TPA: 4-hydroxy-tetrahydrodipicolinate reductase [Rhodanobacteraceae bacterium]|nr:4-hydroxy-tetrahydrodipicolinate reductase [Rhodanobacteraceae bacterium]